MTCNVIRSFLNFYSEQNLKIRLNTLQMTCKQVKDYPTDVRLLVDQIEPAVKIYFYCIKGLKTISNTLRVGTVCNNRILCGRVFKEC